MPLAPAAPTETPRAHASRVAAAEMLLLGTALFAVFAGAAALPDWPGHVGRLQALMAVAFVFYALAVARLPRWRAWRHAGLVALIVALALRAVLIPLTPQLSGDLYRYVWDGRLLAHGLDPYRFAPADPALAAWRDAVIHPRINHPELRTIYPPLAEAGFALVARLSPGVLAMKLWIAAHDLALVAVLAWWCGRRGGGAADALIYAWNPLLVLEYAGSGHHDPTGLLWLALAMALARERPLGSAAAFAAAVLVKLAPLVVLPFLWREWPWRARALALALIAPGLALFARAASGPRSGLAAYAATWRNNELFFHYAAAAFGDRGARAAVAALVVVVVAVAWVRRADLVAGARTALRTLLVAGPVMHPWYLGWALVFEPLRPSAPWLLLSALAILNYGPLATPADPAAFHLPLAWRWFEYGLPLLLAGALALHARRRQGENPAHA